CGYCRSVGYLGWQTHTRQRCQQLRRLAACKICGATGAMNHTETYCPEKPPVYLPHSSRFLRSLENRRSARDYQFFTKYASLIEAIYSTSNDNLLF
uniref:Nanos-type domain-containing protein n=1 Tax=Caenorhabditis japonica TaxID=281687 RepID=A0A8R1ICJ3_CAEJA